ncbi:MAG TPA: hypothetical protein PKE29_14015 [Phycisphaerales bacterium]|nr:hypothetical protein [Phycisphaerales bacterium]
MSPTPAIRTRAVTLVELLVVIAVLIVVIAILLPAISTPRCRGGRQLKDANQIRGITQALVVWASNNNSSYPVPSDFDTKDFTLASGDNPAAKNTTGNILSLLVFNGSISPEICISPAEANTAQVQRYDDYQYANPRAAANPREALWDPNFRGTPEDVLGPDGKPLAGVANQSYAHTAPLGKRRAQWSDTYNSTEAVFGNRGPTYIQSDAAPSSTKWPLLAGPLGTGSFTLLIHGGRSTWEGNIAYNDNHVNFETSPTPAGVTFPISGPILPGKPLPRMGPDNLFVNESDEFEGDGISGTVDKGTNAYLRPIAGAPDMTRVRSWRD